MFRRNIFLLSSSTVIGQCILLLATLVLARIFPPAAFGGFATFSALYVTLAGIGTLRYELAIPAVETEEQAELISAVVLLSALVISTAITVAILVTWLLSARTLPTFSLYIPLCMIIVAQYAVAQQWSARLGTYSSYSISVMISAIMNSGVAILLGMNGIGTASALVAAFAVGLASATAFMFLSRFADRHLAAAWRRIRPFSGVLAAARNWIEFPRLVLPTFLATSASILLPVLILGRYFTQSEVGYYALAMRFLLAPSALVGSAVLETLRAELFRRKRENVAYLPVIRRLLRLGLLVGLPLLVVAFAVGGELLVVAAGSQFISAAELVPALATAALFLSLMQPLQSVFLVTRHHRAGLVAQLALALFPNAALAVLAWRGHDLQVVLAVYAGVIGLIGAGYLVATWRLAKFADIDRGLVRTGAAGEV